MEVFLKDAATFSVGVGLLHVRGGVSRKRGYFSGGLRSSPRPWRCFRLFPVDGFVARVFSTSVEVFLAARLFYPHDVGLLHVRGGVSDSSIVPASWVWVFSTSVEVFLRARRCSHNERKSSPRPWRCFFHTRIFELSQKVFSTSVEVFPSAVKDATGMSGLLHVRGGVSLQRGGGTSSKRSSPRPWRCFFRGRFVPSRARVFSTSVEVFPDMYECLKELQGLLHVRGGVSTTAMEAWPPTGSSPRPWRCFLQPSSRRAGTSVFSTSVEVFP